MHSPRLSLVNHVPVTFLDASSCGKLAITSRVGSIHWEGGACFSVYAGIGDYVWFLGNGVFVRVEEGGMGWFKEGG